MSIYTNYFNGPRELWHYRENDACKNMIAVAKVVSMLTVAIPLMIGLAWCISSLCDREVVVESSSNETVDKVEVVALNVLTEANVDPLPTIFSEAFVNGDTDKLKVALKTTSIAQLKEWIESASPLSEAVTTNRSFKSIISTLIEDCPKELIPILFAPHKRSGMPPMWVAMKSVDFLQRLEWILDSCPDDMLPHLLVNSKMQETLIAPVDIGIAWQNDLQNPFELIKTRFEKIKEKDLRNNCYRLFMGFNDEKSFYNLLISDISRFVKCYLLLPEELRRSLLENSLDLHRFLDPNFEEVHLDTIEKSFRLEEDRRAFFKFLINYKDDKSILFYVVQKENLDYYNKINFVIEKFPKYKDLFFEPNKQNITPLMFALKSKLDFGPRAIRQLNTWMGNSRFESFPIEGKTICSWAIEEKCKPNRIITLLENADKETLQSQLKDSWYPLIELILEENFYRVKWYCENFPGPLEELITHLKNAHAKHPNNISLFQLAIQSGRKDLIEKLLNDCEGNPTKLKELLQPATSGKTALYSAVEKEDTQLVIKLMEIVSNNLGDLRPLFQHARKEYSVLQLACDSGNLTLTETVLNWYPKCIGDLLFEPSEEGSALHISTTLEVIECVLKKCPKRLYPLLLQANKKGVTPLEFAARYSEETVPAIACLYSEEEIGKIIRQNPFILGALPEDTLKTLIQTHAKGGIFFKTLIYKSPPDQIVPIIHEFREKLHQDNPLNLDIPTVDLLLRALIKENPSAINELFDKGSKDFTDQNNLFHVKMQLKLASKGENPTIQLMRQLAGPMDEVYEFLKIHKKATDRALEAIKLTPYPKDSPSEGYDIVVAFENIKSKLGDKLNQDSRDKLQTIVTCAKAKRSDQWQSFKKETFIPLERYLEWIFFKLEQENEIYDDGVIYLEFLATYGSFCPTPWCESAQKMYHMLYPMQKEQSVEDQIHSIGALFRQENIAVLTKELAYCAIKCNSTLNFSTVLEFYQNIHYQNQLYSWLPEEILLGRPKAADPELPGNLKIEEFNPTQDSVKELFAQLNSDEMLIQYYTTYFNKASLEFKESVRDLMGITDMSEMYEDDGTIKLKFVLSVLIKTGVYESNISPS